MEHLRAVLSRTPQSCTLSRNGTEAATVPSAMSMPFPYVDFRVGSLCVFMLIILFALPASAAKARLPEWARETIETVGRKPVFYDETAEAEYLFREEIVTFGDDDAIEKNVDRRIVRILTEKGVVHGHDYVYGYNRLSRIVSIKAWTLKPNGNVVELSEDDIRDMPRYARYNEYSDIRYKVFSVPEVARGDLIIVEVETHYTHPVWSTGFSGDWRIQDKRPWLPTHLARFTLQLERDWSFNHRVYETDNLADRRTEANSTVWEWRDMEVPMGDVNGNPPTELRYVCSTEDPRWADRNRISWDDISGLYHWLSKDRLVPSAEMKQVVAQLIQTANTPLEKIRAIANYVRKNINYVAVEMGIGGYQPRHVQNTFKNRYGDCKDMSSMIVSLLGEAEITAYPALIRTLDVGKIDPDFPMQYFNHCIAYVPGVPETEDWIEAWPEHDRFGRSLWIDATSEYASVEDMPWSIQGTHALVVTPDKGHLIETPVFGPGMNVERRSAQAKLSPAGDLHLQGEEHFTGVYNIRRRSILKRRTEEDRQKWLQQYLGNRVPRIKLESFQHSALDDLDEKVMIRYRFTAGRYANRAGNLMFFRPNIMILWKQNPFPDDQMQESMAFTHPFTEIDTLSFKLPPSYVADNLPEEMNLVTEFGSYRTTCTVEDDTLTYTRHLSVKYREIPPESYAAIKAFFGSVVKSDKNMVVLKRNPASPY